MGVTFEGTLFVATLVAILVNLAGWEGLRSYYFQAVASGRGACAGIAEGRRPLKALSVYLSWIIRIEFFYYLVLLVVIVQRPELLPAWAVVWLFLYHAFGFIGSESFKPFDRPADAGANRRRAAAVFGLIGVFELLEIILLIFFAISLWPQI